MGKVTTADCKKFLTEQIANNPVIINEIFKGDPQVIMDALDVKKWSRESKFSPTGNHDYAEPEYEVWRPMYGRSQTVTIPATDLNAVRRFILDPEQYDTGVIFNVLEDKQGNLILGQYVGD